MKKRLFNQSVREVCTHNVSEALLVQFSHPGQVSLTTRCTILRGRFKGAGSRSIPQRQLPMLYLPIRADRTYVLSAIEHRKLN